MTQITKNGRKLTVEADRVAYGSPLFQVVVTDVANGDVSKAFVNAFSVSHAMRLVIDGARA
jgi:hypothetical protein